MAEAVMNITDTELTRLLRASYIDREQVKELQPLIPILTEEEREQLMDLINQSHEEAEQAESAYQERISDINAQYDIELNNLIKESTEKALKEFKGLEEEKGAAELKAVEGEMAEIFSDAEQTDPVANQPIQSAKPAQNRHVLAKLIIIALFILAVAAIYIYSSLNA